VGLALLFAVGFVEALAKVTILEFHPGQAADQTLILALEGLHFLGQHSQAAAEVPEFAVAFLAAGTRGRSRGHRNLHKRWRQWQS
jgi:hypothetical protein